jgi:hypothetical protein
MNTEEKGLFLRCPNPNCQYTWSYHGRFIFYATCPACRRNVKIPENKMESLQSVKVGGQSQTATTASTTYTNEGEKLPT